MARERSRPMVTPYMDLIPHRGVFIDEGPLKNRHEAVLEMLSLKIFLPSEIESPANQHTSCDDINPADFPLRSHVISEARPTHVPSIQAPVITIHLMGVPNSLGDLT